MPVRFHVLVKTTVTIFVRTFSRPLTLDSLPFPSLSSFFPFSLFPALNEAQRWCLEGLELWW